MITTKNCPYCDELISINAIKCKHCGSMLSNYSVPGEILDSFTFTKISLSTRFELLKEIGRGGMATVYKAIQKNLQRTVALKVIHQNLIHDKEFLERFHSEARLAASLSHPNIVSIIDEGIENGIHFIAMEYLDGDDLHKIIKYKGRISLDNTIKIIASIAESLDYIHKKKLIHRDIKTSNIILNNDGRAVLTDFGIARAISGSKLSQTGSVLGTPEYMSPEQADGIRSEPRSDLYSLGVVMYECLTGIVPFSGENPVSTIYKIINTPHRPISTINNSIPNWLQTISDKALAKNINDRFASGKEFAIALLEKKTVNVYNKQLNNLRTQKLQIRKTNTIPSPKRNYYQKKYNKINTSENLVQNRLNKIPYLIGGTIILLLISIVVLLLNNYYQNTNSSKPILPNQNDKVKTLLKDSIPINTTIQQVGEQVVKENKLNTWDSVSSKRERKIDSDSFVIVPSVIGETQTAASERISSLGLKVNPIKTLTAGEKGKVIGQRPSVGSRIRKGDVVTIKIIE